MKTINLNTEYHAYLMINGRKIYIGEQRLKEIEQQGIKNQRIFNVSLIMGMLITSLLALIAYFIPIYADITAIGLILLWISIIFYLFISFRQQGSLPIVYQEGDHE